MHYAETKTIPIVLKKTIKGVLFDVEQELQSATTEHGEFFASNHEGYGVIMEEIEELWDEIKKKRSKRDPALMRAEAIQVAAIAVKFIRSMEERGDV